MGPVSKISKENNNIVGDLLLQTGFPLGVNLEMQGLRAIRKGDTWYHSLFLESWGRLVGGTC